MSVPELEALAEHVGRVSFVSGTTAAARGSPTSDGFFLVFFIFVPNETRKRHNEKRDVEKRDRTQLFSRKEEPSEMILLFRVF